MNIGAFTTKYITGPIRKFSSRNSIDTIGAIKTYNDSLRMLVDDFSGKQSVPNCNLKAVYDTLMVAYSQILAVRKIDKKMIKSLKKLGIAGMEWAHVARLSDADKEAFVRGLTYCSKTKMIQQAAFKNNSGKIMMSVLEDERYMPLLKKAGLNVEQFKTMLKTGQGDLFNLDIIDKPLKDSIFESKKRLGLRMIKRIITNERNAKASQPSTLLPCFDKKILSENYDFPEIEPEYCFYKDTHGFMVGETDKYLDAFDRFKILDIVGAKLKGRNIGLTCKER